MTLWTNDIFQVLVNHQVRQVAYVPDAGHTHLINRCGQYGEMVSVPLTTEEEGIALLAGAWLGGDRGVLLMQSSGVGNCLNMFSFNTNLPYAFTDVSDDAWRMGRVQSLAGSYGTKCRKIIESC